MKIYGLGKKYPDTSDERKEKAKFYSGDLDADQRRKNLLLSQDISREMKTAQEWAAALNRAGDCWSAFVWFKGIRPNGV